MGGGLSKEDMENYRQITHGLLNARDINKLYEKFFKVAPSGYMNPQLFKQYIENLKVFKGSIQPGETYDQLFRAYDVDHDQSISFEDFLKYHTAMLRSAEPAVQDELFEIVFAMYDVNTYEETDQNRVIRREEIVEVITNSTRWMGNCPEGLTIDSPEVKHLIQSEVDKLLTFLDGNTDGSITRNELRDIAKTYPGILEKMKNLA
eukprot:PhF_6_TR24991/c1_g1_i1/m.34383